MMTVLLITAVLWLAFANGANDNFKGVATLYGSGAARYRTALLWSAGTTLAGSLLSLGLASSLARSFSGAGFVGEDVAASAAFGIAVGGATAITILLATWLGMPTSTTHALTGALIGVALLVDGGSAARTALVQKFLVPLATSPLLAASLTMPLFWVLRRSAIGRGKSAEACLCLAPVAKAAAPNSAALAGSSTLVVGHVAECERTLGSGGVLVRSGWFVSALHFASAGAACLARAVNDTPKISALLLTTSALGGRWGLGATAAAVVAGGLLASRRVAETMSRRITHLDPVEGLSANLVTAGLVLGASRLGLPVSTTHVSCGAIFGIGAATREASWRTIGQILLAWLTTLPLAAILGASLYDLLR
jgi:PiT family inorganic phosphate transporter